MIGIGNYEKAVEDKYWEYVNDVIDPAEQKKIVNSCKKYMPPDFFSQKCNFEELVMAPYKKLKEAYIYINENKLSIMNKECFRTDGKGKLVRKHLYKKLYDAYGKVSKKMVDGVKMNVFLVDNIGLTVCPYCNRDYINSRSKKLAGAELDHFFPHAKYPIFSVCLYNLVPSCGNCNRIKHENMQDFASPFDEEIDWENVLRFSYEPLNMNSKKITIDPEERIKHNIEEMHIEAAYQIHVMEVNELLDKVEMYSETQVEEFKAVLCKIGITEQEMKEMVFGPEITEESMKKRPLGRMMRDLERELGIYK